MFTGIIQEVGTVRSITRKGTCWTIAISSTDIVKRVEVSESVCSNGACLTVVKKAGAMLYFDVMQQTLKTTRWNDAKVGDLVNMETSLALNGKLDGHFVLGHVDDVVVIKNLSKGSDGTSIECELPEYFRAFVVAKGSVTIDGISLTIASCTKNSFTVMIIPYTWEHTSLKNKKTGSKINVEFDYLAKLVCNAASLNNAK